MATYLIDYENVSKDGLNGVTKLTEDDRVIIFYSERADRMTFGLHRRLNETKAVIEYKKVDVGGRNALDFQLATYLGFLMAKNPQEEYCVVSNDRGYEYLVGFWRKPLYNVTLTRAIASSPQAEERRQARRNAQRQEAERSGKQVGEEAAAEENRAVIAAEKKLLMTVPDAKERQIEPVRNTPSAIVKVESKPVVTVLPIDNGDTEEPETPEPSEEPADERAAEAAPAPDRAVEPDLPDLDKEDVNAAVSPAKQDEEAESAISVPSGESAVQSPNARGTKGIWLGSWKPKKADANGEATEAEENAAVEKAGESSGNPVSSAEEAEPDPERKSAESGEPPEEPEKPAEETGSTEPEKAAPARTGRSSRGGRKPSRRTERRAPQENAEAANEPESGKAKEPDDDPKKDASDGAAETKSGRRNSRARKKTSGRGRKKAIPRLEEVRSLLGGSALQEPDLEEIAGYVEKYKTRQGVNNALVRKFGNQKGGEVYQSIKPLLKDKKGREAPKKSQTEA